MRRFVQAFSGCEDIPHLSTSINASLRAVPERYNVSVRQQAAVLFEQHGRWHIQQMTWGLVPSWANEPRTKYTTQTARLQHAPTSRIFRRAWQDRRCVVPMNGYYKWDRERRPPWPYFIQSTRGHLLFAAGLWERWEDDDSGLELHSFAILTHSSMAIPRPLTPDGPIFLPPSHLDRWSTCDPRRATRFALGVPQPELEIYPVSRRIARRDIEDYTLLEPVDPAEADEAYGPGNPQEVDEDE
jgi:putative SOS response-associated peptidase YedK